MQMTKKTGIDRAIEFCGGITALANKCGVSYQAVHRWQKNGFVPNERIASVQKATEKKILLADLVDSSLKKAIKELNK
jgi:DNA-binding transcriptional regulator YdaS (Cro superfamily)